MADESGTQPSAVYLTTGGPELEKNFELAQKHGVWGVLKKAGHRLGSVEVGDFVLITGSDFGFVLCRITRESYRSKEQIWSDKPYPHRVGISSPLARRPDMTIGDLHACLRDMKRNRPYKSRQAVGAALRGTGGTSRNNGDSIVDLLVDLMEADR